MPTPRFDPTISLGHILTIGCTILPFFVWVVATNAAQDVRLTAVEVSVRTITQSLVEAEKRQTDATTELRTGIRRIDDKITALLTQGLAPVRR